MPGATFARHLLVAGLEAGSGLELDSDSTPGGGGGGGGHERGRGTERGGGGSPLDRAASVDFNPLERAYRPRMLRVLPEPASSSSSSEDGEQQKWYENFRHFLILISSLPYVYSLHFANSSFFLLPPGATSTPTPSAASSSPAASASAPTEKWTTTRQSEKSPSSSI